MEQVFFTNETVDQVNLPSTSGDMGLLADHVPMISQLRPGVVDVIVGGKTSKRIFGVFSSCFSFHMLMTRLSSERWLRHHEPRLDAQHHRRRGLPR